MTPSRRRLYLTIADVAASLIGFLFFLLAVLA